MVALARAAQGRTDRHAALVSSLTDLYAARAEAHGWYQGRDALRQLLGMDIELNTQGLEVWLDR